MRQRGCLLRMKCIDDIFEGQINKAKLTLRYKFLLHVLIQCLSNRRSGYDMASNDLIGLMVALVLNKPFNISKYLFSNMKENLRRTGASDDGDGGDDEGGEGGDGGNVGASGASARSGDNDESESDDNPPEPGYEHYIEERGIRKVRRIRTNQDEDYVPSDTEAERLKKKQTSIRRKKRMKKTIGTSSAEPAATQHETVTKPIHEAIVNPDFAFTAEETTAMMTSTSAATEPPPTATTTTETPAVTPLAEPQHETSSSHQQ
ncbi:hypothetical protein HanLR1_Chr10g0364121 [Helianthus annuus]|nr:hypothetical protein HanLR1_Chr10g0364121 [Helianthus annuus]